MVYILSSMGEISCRCLGSSWMNSFIAFGCIGLNDREWSYSLSISLVICFFIIRSLYLWLISCLRSLYKSHMRSLASLQYTADNLSNSTVGGIRHPFSQRDIWEMDLWPSNRATCFWVKPAALRALQSRLLILVLGIILTSTDTNDHSTLIQV